MTQSTWYRNTGKVPVKGVLWHSTGANNPTVARYVQPDDNVPDRAELIEKIGKNQYGNDWNHVYVESGVHAFIGKIAGGEVAAVQTGEWDKKAWGCGAGKRGSCNNGWIQFEICEDNLKDPAFFEKIYREGVELTAYLCKLYGLDPHGTVQYCGVTVPVILCHADSAWLGLGSDHGDVLHWFPKFGKSMETVRDDAAALLAEDNSNEEDENMTNEQKEVLFREFLDRMTGEEIAAKLYGYLTPQELPDWAEGELREAMDMGITDGTRPMGYVHRFEAALMAKRAAQAK